MTCEQPGIMPIDDSCCFSCFMTGRVGYDDPIAIVLHEVDEHIEALNNRMENCCNDDPDCHSSFHYGVGQDGRIINWVDPDDTAWSFDPVNSDTSCGVCGWSIATQEGTSTDPNLYTINIAVSTGILSVVSGQQFAQNTYSDSQYEALVRLTGWLAETYNIVINQNTVWRHCDELNDFPGSCDKCFTYAKFLEDVQDCIDSPDFTCDYECHCLQNAEPVTPGPCDLSSWTSTCAEDDCECDCDECVCGCNEVLSIGFCDSDDPARMTVTGLPFETCLVDGNQGVNLQLDEDEQSNTVVLEFPQEQNNFSLCFAQFGNTTDEQITFTPAPDSVDGDLVLNGAVVTSSVDSGQGCVIWTGPIENLTFVYDTSDVIEVDEEHAVCMNQMQSDECFCDQPAPLVPGVLLQGCDCKCYTFTDVAGQVDFCSLMQAAVPAATEEAVPGQTMLLARDCDSYYLPELCNQITALPEDTNPDQLMLLGRNTAGDECSINPIDPVCDDTEYAASAFSVGDVSGGLGFHRMRPSMPFREATNGQSLIPAEDGVVALDATNASVIFTLTAPGPCDPNSFWISRLDCNDQASVTINGGANTINGQAAITLDTPGRWGCGETAHLYWNGTEWMTI